MTTNSIASKIVWDDLIPRYCPQCNVDLIGTPIPEQNRRMFGGYTHFCRVIGVELDRDRIEYWKCPDCSHEWK